MFDLIVLGIVTGVLAGFFWGPFSVILSYESIHRGVGAALLLLLGARIGDLVIFAIIHYGAGNLLMAENFQKITGLSAVIILSLLGAACIAGGIRRSATPKNSADVSGNKISVLKGLSLTIMTPFPFLFWTGTYAAIVQLGFKTNQMPVFFGVLVAAVSITDLLKILLSIKLGNLLKKPYIRVFEITAGVILLIAASIILGAIYIPGFLGIYETGGLF